MIVVITGPDGSGKSTACRETALLLEKKLGAGSVSIASIWDAAEHSQLFSSKRDVQNYLIDLDGYTRTLFIFHAIHRSLDLAIRKNSKIILIDGYWYKYAVSEITLGVSSEWVISAGRKLPHPDLSFYLDLHPRDALSRKERFSPYERGASLDRFQPLSPVSFEIEREQFLQFQSQLILTWKKLEHQLGPWMHLSAKNAPSTLSQTLSQECLKQMSYLAAC